MEIVLNKKTLNILMAFLLIPMAFVFAIFIATSSPTSNNRQESQNIAGNIQDEVRIKVNASEFLPSVVTIPVGRNVRLIAENDGAAGCTSSLVSRDLFDGALIMGPKGSTVEKMIRAEKAGEYSITCSMGMVEMKVVAI